MDGGSSPKISKNGTRPRRGVTFTDPENGNATSSHASNSMPISVTPEDERRPLIKIETEDQFRRSFLEKRDPGEGALCSCKAPSWNQVASSILGGFQRSFPVIKWFPKYSPKQDALRDLVIGVTLAFVIAPKAMAHALLGNLPPVYGIYTAFGGTLIYGLMGTSKWVSCGTGALPSLLFGEALASLALNSQDMVLVAPMLTLLIGLFTVVLFALRLDKFVPLLPPAALNAVTTASAFLIGTSQVKYLFGVKIKAEGFVQTYVALFSHISDTNVVTLILSIFCIGFLWISKQVLTSKLYSKCGIPDIGALVVVIVTVVLEATLKLSENHGVSVVGPTPAGMPPPILPWSSVSGERIVKLLPNAAVLAVINFILFITVAKNFARKSNSELSVVQELKAVAMVNIGTSFIGGLVVAASFSGSAIVASLKATSMMHNFLNSFMMMLILLFMTPVIEVLPTCALASIIVAALPSLVDHERPVFLWQIRVDDFSIWFVTFCVTLFFGVQYGIIAGLVVAIMMLVYRNVRSDFSEIGVLPGTAIYRSLERFPEARRVPGIVMYRIDASLSFANFEAFECCLENAIKKELAGCGDSVTVTGKTDQPVHTVILDMGAVNDIDTAAIDMLSLFAKTCEDRMLMLYFSGWKWRCRNTLYHSHTRWLKDNGHLNDTISSHPIKTFEVSRKESLDAQPANQASLGDLELRNISDSGSPTYSVNVVDSGSSREVVAHSTTSFPAVGGSDSSPLHTGARRLQENDLMPYSYRSAVAHEATHDEPAIINPNRWFLNLHDAVVRARLEMLNAAYKDAHTADPLENRGSTRSGTDVAEQVELENPEMIIEPMEQPLTTTREVTASGATVVWNYAENTDLRHMMGQIMRPPASFTPQGSDPEVNSSNEE